MLGPDPRRDDDTEELPSAAEAFTSDPTRRAHSAHIAARAAALLSLFRRPGVESRISQHGEDELPTGPLEQPAWEPAAFVDAFAQLEDFARGALPAVPELRTWAASLPDDATPRGDTTYGWVAGVQAEAADGLFGL